MARSSRNSSPTAARTCRGASWARVKLPQPPADPAHMLAASLSNDVWLGVGFIAAITVLACLGLICNVLRYELEFIRVVAGAKKLRDKLVCQIDEAEGQDAYQANAPPGRPETIDSPSPIPAAAESAEPDAIVDSPPEPDAEHVATDSAQAA